MAEELVCADDNEAKVILLLNIVDFEQQSMIPLLIEPSSSRNLYISFPGRPQCPLAMRKKVLPSQQPPPSLKSENRRVGSK